VDSIKLSVVGVTREVYFDVGTSIRLVVVLSGKLDFGEAVLGGREAVLLAVTGLLLDGILFSACGTAALLFVDVDAFLLVGLGFFVARKLGRDRGVLDLFFVTFPSDARSPRR